MNILEEITASFPSSNQLSSPNSSLVKHTHISHIYSLYFPFILMQQGLDPSLPPRSDNISKESKSHCV